MNNAANESAIKQNAELYDTFQQPWVAKLLAGALNDDPAAMKKRLKIIVSILLSPILIQNKDGAILQKRYGHCTISNRPSWRSNSRRNL